MKRSQKQTKQKRDIFSSFDAFFKAHQTKVFTGMMASVGCLMLLVAAIFVSQQNTDLIQGQIKNRLSNIDIRITDAQKIDNTKTSELQTWRITINNPHTAHINTVLLQYKTSEEQGSKNIHLESGKNTFDLHLFPATNIDFIVQVPHVTDPNPNNNTYGIVQYFDN